MRANLNILSQKSILLIQIQHTTHVTMFSVYLICVNFHRTVSFYVTFRLWKSEIH